MMGIKWSTPLVSITGHVWGGAKLKCLSVVFSTLTCTCLQWQRKHDALQLKDIHTTRQNTTMWCQKEIRNMLQRRIQLQHESVYLSEQEVEWVVVRDKSLEEEEVWNMQPYVRQEGKTSQWWRTQSVSSCETAGDSCGTSGTRSYSDYSVNSVAMLSLSASCLSLWRLCIYSVKFDFHQSVKDIRDTVGQGTLPWQASNTPSPHQHPVTCFASEGHTFYKSNPVVLSGITSLSLSRDDIM